MNELRFECGMELAGDEAGSEADRQVARVIEEELLRVG